ncbi:MAG: ribosome biogenesis GTPase Der [Proteobacteria bacterium]|nr:ribosome biogenesis GTPase Der [Pseudomonadota bacterium]
MALTVAIVGRPNVGKSTLFNRLVGKQLALVDDTPGVTRDRREGEARISDLSFRAIDTAGLEEGDVDSLQGRMMAQTNQAVDLADVVLLVIDARAGITAVDRHFAELLRRDADKVLVIANKCEGRVGEQGYLDAFSLGLGDPVPLSAMEGHGLADLYEALRPAAEAHASGPAVAPGGDLPSPKGTKRPEGLLHLAIVGRPNVGKSTLANGLIGEERLLTGPEPGLTRDAVPLDWSYDGVPIRLVDTAGLRRRSKATGKLEGMSAKDTHRAIRYAEVAVLVLDGTEGLNRQDLAIGRHTVDEGRALVVAVNKWDVVPHRREALLSLQERLDQSLPQARGVPVVPISALEGTGLDKLMNAVFGSHERWNRRLSTGRLNRWLGEIEAHHPPPLAGGKRVRLRYITQVKARPPTFALFSNRPAELAESYLRYMANALREDFDLTGVPIRIRPRGGKNPYSPDKD